MQRWSILTFCMDFQCYSEFQYRKVFWIKKSSSAQIQEVMRGVLSSEGSVVPVASLNHPWEQAWILPLTCVSSHIHTETFRRTLYLGLHGAVRMRDSLSLMFCSYLEKKVEKHDCWWLVPPSLSREPAPEVPAGSCKQITRHIKKN